jgi:tetratricopeptide (TPR) repeat protein
MIVRDEEEFLGPCLESARAVVDEIVVVDTGSNDRTVEIAQEHGARLIHQPWQDHFAAARNRGLAAATGDFVLQLDADERLDPDTSDAVRLAVEQDDFDLGLVSFLDMDGAGKSARQWQAPRVFRRTPGARFFGRVHEQVALECAAVRRKVIAATVLHFGYTPALYLSRRKIERSERLLRLALDDAESQDPVIRANYLYHLAQLGRDRELFERFEEYAGFIRDEWGAELPAVPWVSGGLVQHCILLSDQGRHIEAAPLARELLGRYGEAPLLRFVLARAAAAAGELAAADRELAQVLRPDAQLSLEHSLYGGDLALVRSRAHFLQGLLRDWQNQPGEALTHYQSAYTEEPDQEYFLGAMLCLLVRLGRYVPARDLLEGAGVATAGSRPQLDCLGLALALLTRSGGRVAFWGTKVRAAAETFPAARHMLERMEELGSRRPYSIEDFPELRAAIWNVPDPSRFALPPTIRKSSLIGTAARADQASG